MSLRISLWTGLIGIGATIALVQPNIASAKSSVEIAKTARAITVLITAPDSVGSGVMLQRQGDTYTVLTAAHVVPNKGKVDYKITTSDNRKYDIISSSIRSAPGSIDLAVVKFKSTANYPIAQLGNCNILESGMDLYVSGFPGTSRVITQPIFVFREGKVTANSNETFEKGYSLVYSNDTLPGMSGGAVLNSDGELVAIHGRGDKDDSGAKTGFNLGIPVNRFATVASNMGVELGQKVAAIPQNTAPKADDYLVSAVQKYNKGDIQGSLADSNQAIALNPQSAIAYVSRGLLKYEKLNDVQGALADYNQAIALNPNNADAYAYRGLLKAQKANDVRVPPIDRGQVPIARVYNNSVLQERQRRLADDAYRDLLTRQQTDAAVYRSQMRFKKLEYVQDALADYTQAISLKPNYAAAYAYRGLLKYEHLNDAWGAILDMQQAVKLYQQQGKQQDAQNAIALIRQWQQ